MSQQMVYEHVLERLGLAHAARAAVPMTAHQLGLVVHVFEIFGRRSAAGR